VDRNKDIISQMTIYQLCVTYNYVTSSTEQSPSSEVYSHKDNQSTILYIFINFAIIFTNLITPIQCFVKCTLKILVIQYYPASCYAPLGPNILLRTLFSNTFNQFPCL